MTRGEVLDQLTKLADRLEANAEQQRQVASERFDAFRSGARHGFDISTREVRAVASAIEATWRVDEAYGL